MFRIGGITYSPDHILAMLDPGSPQRCADRSGANDSDTHEYLLVSHENQLKRFQRSIKNGTPKNGPGDGGPEWRLRRRFPQTETKPCLRNAAVRRVRAVSIC